MDESGYGCRCGQGMEDRDETERKQNRARRRIESRFVLKSFTHSTRRYRNVPGRVRQRRHVTNPREINRNMTRIPFMNIPISLMKPEFEDLELLQPVGVGCSWYLEGGG